MTLLCDEDFSQMDVGGDDGVGVGGDDDVTLWMWGGGVEATDDDDDDDASLAYFRGVLM